MFGRPRCREWTPLATQQLRLRSLIQIVGYNIRPPEWCKSQCSFYLTLHHTTMSAPFYTSEKISSPHPKWKEIDSEITQRMSSTNVVIRIWCHILHPSDDGTTPQNTVIQTWGVYFSGLRYIGANLASNFTSDCFKSNTLVFQMHGGYFCSYKSLKLDIIPPENELEHGSLSSDSSGRTNLSKITLESKLITSNKLKESRSISPSKYNRRGDKEYSKSHSPSERGFQNFALRYSASMNIDHDRRRDDSSERVKENQNHIYEYSPDHMDVMEFTSTEANCDSLYKNASQEELSASKIDLSETAESYDLRSEAGVPKYRYMALNFLKSEIRPSYNASKLQTLHLLQYAIKKKQEAVQEIKEKIYKNSSVTSDSWSQPDELEARLKLRRSERNLFDDDEISKTKEQTDSSKNGRIDRPVTNGPRLTLKLNDLLAYKSKPSPFQRAEHVRLTKQLEVLRFKRIILSDERDSKLANIRRLKERRAKLYEENQDIGSELMQNYHTLSKRADAVKESRQTCAAMRDLAARAHAALANQRCELLHQLHQIFYMDQHDQSTWSICGVPFAVCGDENPRNTNPVSDSVAAGFVAQATCLAASILNQPLRYKITLLGSASKILDITPDLPDPNIPLFARGGDRTLFHYAMFLLNKCIAQLLWGRGLPITDIRPTLANLQRLLITPSNLSDTTKLFGTHRWVVDSQYPRTQSLRSLVAGDRGKYRQFNRFKDAVDGQPPEIAMTLRMHRHSRSVGSYHDDQELPALNASTTSIMGSESNIYNMKLIQNTSQELKSHSSDSAINSFAVDKYSEIPQKVEFTLGDGEKLVKLSSNNEDVKRICSEIKDYCSINEGLDVVNHIDGIKEYMRRVSEIDVCEVCESNNIEEHMRRASEIDICERYESNGNKDIKEHMRRASQIDICERCQSNKDGECDMECANRVTDVTILPSAEAILDIGQVFENNESNG